MVAYTRTPTGSEDDGGSRDPPSPPSGLSDTPRRREDRDKSGASALSPPVDKLRGCRGGVHRRLTYDDGGTPQGALQAVGARLRHPLVIPKPETPVQRWLDDVTNMVTAAQRQLAAGGRIAATGTSCASTALPSSSSPPPTFGRRHLRNHALASGHARTPQMSPTSSHPTTLPPPRPRDGIQFLNPTSLSSPTSPLRRCFTPVLATSRHPMPI